MADSKRQKLINAMVARMQTILTANGYETDLGLRVGDWQTNWDESECPAVSVCDLVADDDGDESGDPFATGAMSEQALPVMFRIFSKSNTPATELRKMIADVVKAIGTDTRWTDAGVKLAMKTIPKRAGLIVPTDNFEVAGAAVEVEVLFITKLFNEYE